MLLGLILAAGAGSFLLGQDANWDLQNYHYYNPWAWWNGRILHWDIAAAQIQTYHNPLLDFPFFGMVSAGWPPRLIAFVLSIPTALAGFFVYKIAWIVLADLRVADRWMAAACAVVIGITSAMGIGAVGNTMNEWPLAALVVFALWWLLRAQDADGAMARSALLVAGLAAGFAAGAKLTAAVFVLAIAIALLVRGPGLRLADASWFAVGSACGFALAYGAWGYALWTNFRNPIFPYANEYFASPWWQAESIPGREYGPQSLQDFLLFPLALGQPPLYLVAEVPYRDMRLPIVWTLAIAAAAVWIFRRLRTRSPRSRRHDLRLVGWFCAASFALWTIAFSIYRYLLPIDALSGVVIAAILVALLPRRAALGTLVVCTVALVLTTRIADWGRVPFGNRWFEAQSMPIVEPDSLVLITTGEAVTYFIPMLPASSRYLGALNTLLNPRQSSRLAQEVRDVVRNHKGYAYQMTHPLTAGEEVLFGYGLVRTSACAVVVTNMPVSPIEFCMLMRIDEEP